MTSILKVDNIKDSANNQAISISSGAVNFNTGISDNIVFTQANKGIYLGTTSATASNLLNDYEEGTWTPTLLASSSNPAVQYSSQTGHYTKVGASVTVTCYMQTTSVSGGSGAMLVGSLPFAVSGTKGYAAAQHEYIGIQMPSNANSIFTRTNPSATALTFEFQDMRAGVVNAARSGILIGACAATTRLIATYTYFTDA